MATPGTIHRYGDRALLIECTDAAAVIALDHALRAAELPEVSDIVPGARTVLVRLRATGLQTVMHDRLAAVGAPEPRQAIAGAGLDAVFDDVVIDDVVIDVVYDGADLDEVAEILGMTPGEVIDAHTGTPWRAGFVGFAPGFAYLVDGDPRLRVPRREAPRTRVPSGSVALAGEFSGVYPRESPGGWQLIGRTDAALSDASQDVPALLRPGMTVRFRSVGGMRPGRS